MFFDSAFAKIITFESSFDETAGTISKGSYTSPLTRSLYLKTIGFSIEIGTPEIVRLKRTVFCCGVSGFPIMVGSSTRYIPKVPSSRNQYAEVSLKESSMVTVASVESGMLLMSF